MENEFKEYLCCFERYHAQIDEFIELLKKEDAEERERINKATSVDFDNIDNLVDTRLSNKFLETCEPDLLILLYNLFESGREVDQGHTKLSELPTEQQQQEFVKLCNELLAFHGLCFGKKPQSHQLNIFGKDSFSLLKHISTATSIIDKNRLT